MVPTIACNKPPFAIGSMYEAENMVSVNRDQCKPGAPLTIVVIKILTTGAKTINAPAKAIDPAKESIAACLPRMRYLYINSESVVKKKNRKAYANLPFIGVVITVITVTTAEINTRNVG